MSQGYIPKERLTAYQRWELAAFDEAEREAEAAAATAEAEALANQAPEIEEEPPHPLPTAEEIEAIYEEARRSGYAAGFEEGREAGHVAGQEAAEAVGRAEAERLSALIDDLGESIKNCEQQVAEQLLAVALEIARQVLRHSLQVKPELILPVVREAIAALPVSHGHPLLLVNPADAALVRDRLGDGLAHSGWKLIEDLQIEPGGCRVEVAGSEVDATVATRWQRVLEAIGTQADWLAPPP